MNISLIKDKKLLLLVLLLLCIPCFTFAQTNLRAPFVLELPETNAFRYTTPIIRVTATDIPNLKFRVLEPFARKIGYGDIIVTINGDGANRGCSKGRDEEGKFVLCGSREDRLGGFELNVGKNVVEISAIDRNEQEFYASYVLILGDKKDPIQNKIT